MYGYAPQQQEQEVEGSGSGIIVGKNDDELLIATNYHVVEGADTLSVAFTDGNAVEASVKGFDEREILQLYLYLWMMLKMIQWMPFQLRRLAVLMI